MSYESMVQAASGDGGSSPALVPILCFFLVMGLVQVIRPQLLWRLNSRLQRGWVKNPEATEPTEKGYAMQRVVGVLFLAMAVWMLVRAV
ncbi:DUF6199 family natural product biosynthesis protein [Streptomyces sp. DSM 41921]|uniref:DUF6199 family natural product biosynthesis protein n=1 Tax=Streptomyces dubilierae TaxID=3075533 RepID=A0ABU2P3J5_9ACTN|nr:DUF6199 family natural product biosynthesis protein [Streptomyces sp. DSM 41921]MDT0386343.1 DUF6199 family natural product biosynthesis protein [Streptomyces sp. DSM 41921]